MISKLIIVLAAFIYFSLALGELTEGYSTQLTSQIPAIVQNTEASKSKSSPAPKTKPKPSGGGSSSSSKDYGFLGFILGPIVFFSAFPCIFYNQRRAAIQTRRINLAKTICEEVDPTNQAQAQTKNGKLVFAKGQTTTNAYISDPMSGVGGNNLIKITRKVQVLQWRRKTKKQGNQQQVYYELEWVSQNSSTEGERYNNPQNWFIDNVTFYNESVYMGGYKLNQEVTELCDKAVPFIPNNQTIQNILHNSNRMDRNGRVTGQYIYFSSTLSNSYTPPSFDNYQNPTNKRNDSGQSVGTLRVKFQLCPTGPMSLLAKSTVEPNQGLFSSYNIAEYEGTHEEAGEIGSNICCVLIEAYKQFLIPFEQILVVQQKICSQQQLFQQLTQKSKEFTIKIRILAYLSMVFGIYLFFSPIVDILGYIPFVGGFLSGIAWFAIVLGAIILCIPLFTITLSLAWLVYHPKVGLIILSIGLVILGYIWMNGQAAVPSPTPTPTT